MGNKAMIYQEKVKENLKESFIYLQRLNGVSTATQKCTKVSYKKVV